MLVRFFMEKKFVKRQNNMEKTIEINFQEDIQEIIIRQEPAFISSGWSMKLFPCVILVITHSFPLIQQVYTRTDVTYSSSLFCFSFLQRWLRRTVLFITRYLSLKPVCFQTHELIVIATNFFFCKPFLRDYAHLRFKVTWILQTRRKIHAALLHAKCLFLNLKMVPIFQGNPSIVSKMI